MTTPKTAHEWLAVTDLPTKLAKAFDEKGKRQVKHTACWLCSIGNCTGCEHYDIKSDWNTAMKWRDKTIGDLGLQQLAVYNAIYHKTLIDTKENRLIAGSWFSSYLITPRHWFIVIALMIQENNRRAAAMAGTKDG